VVVANEYLRDYRFGSRMKTLLIVMFAAGAVPFAAGVIYCGINFRPGREFLPRKWPIAVMVVGFLLAAAAVLTGIATSGSGVA